MSGQYATMNQRIPTIPTPDKRVDITEFVVARLYPGCEILKSDFEARRNLGIDRYGCPLYAHNGRNALVDAYQEALDLSVYLAQNDIENGRHDLSTMTRKAVNLALDLRIALEVEPWVRGD